MCPQQAFSLSSSPRGPVPTRPHGAGCRGLTDFSDAPEQRPGLHSSDREQTGGPCFCAPHRGRPRGACAACHPLRLVTFLFLEESKEKP